MLLSSSLGGSDGGENKGISDQSQVVEDAQEETQPSADEAAEREEQPERHDNPEDLMMDDPSASEPEPILDMDTDSASVSRVEFEPAADTEEGPEEEEEPRMIQETIEDSQPEEVEWENVETKGGSAASEEEDTAELHVLEREPVTNSEAARIPDLKTTFGTTFEAVATDEETTRNVTPYEEEEEEGEFDKNPEDAADFILPGETPLLSFSQEALSSPPSEDLRQQEGPPAAPEHEEENPENKNLWSSLGDAVFSVVTGGERTPHDLSSDEEGDEEEEEKPALKIARSFEEMPEDENLASELPAPGNVEAVLEEPPPGTLPNDDKETDRDSKRPSADRTEEDDGDVTKPEEPWEDTSKPEGTRTSTMDLLLQDSSAIPESPESDLKAVDEPGEEGDEVFKDPDVPDKTANLESSSGGMDHAKAAFDEEAGNKTDMDEEMVHGGASQYPFAEQEDPDNPDVELGNIFVPDQNLLESNESQLEVRVGVPPITEEILPEEVDYTKQEEETEQLLEDENALLLSHSNSTDFEEPSEETPPPSFSSPEPEYSDSVLRLTLLRDHFTEEKMQQMQKLLGLKNLFKVEAMFSDLDTELQATRRTHTGATQDIENALEGILETSENTILDEIERMLDGQDTKPNYHQDQDLNPSSTDEETEILDDFQELAFTLRQKYSTASDSTPLARKLDVVPGWAVSYVALDNG